MDRQIAGPSSACVYYDKNRKLTVEDIKLILDRINYRRNFIASRLSKYLPGAANMRKIVWSDDLAYSAQRWVDQCDSSTRPDKEDDCRNLESSKVGQNIATMSNLSSNFNIDSFIEMWYMQSQDYSGSVSYYNQSDYKSKYFTQLIWADTDSVGCGQASFYVKNLHKILRRLVCNFSPKGNIHGKPIYLIGYPATQCPEDMIQDNSFKGLCTYDLQHKVSESKLPPETSSVTSLLRILNFSNDNNIFSKKINIGKMFKTTRRGKRNDNIYKTSIPFWRVDDTLNKEAPQLKAIRYTTLSNKKLLHTKQTLKTRTIEPISIKLVTSNHNTRQSINITEKYLSFDELMQLRKMNIGDYDARRQGSTTKATKTAKATTKEVTANTPFVRMKHCTRKLTCTWTVTRMTDCNGSIILQTDGSNRGSRTPPGYVDGCTRTSTCTRDYMDRNKLVSSTEESSSSETTETDDDDYCERRSLHKRSRSSEDDATSSDDDITKRNLSTTITTTKNYMLIDPALIACLTVTKQLAKKELAIDGLFSLVVRARIRVSGKYYSRF
ncbi:uncharacterized protein [Battus philenor]|uniref:uncharacterized protein n=1 Tax=Battus philenor TaxID=42288 RepID=UPI0035D0616B